MGQIVDTETAKEFMKEILEKVDPGQLEQICAEVSAKSDRFQARLSPSAELSAEDHLDLLREIFSVRRKAKKLFDEVGHETLLDWTRELLDGEGKTADRFQAFVDRFETLEEPLPDNVRTDYASELLHFTRPDQYWLWVRWMWDPRTKTGSLPLVTTAAYDLQGKSEGEIYVRVGQAVAFVHEVGEASGFQSISKNIFGTDVFLSCVYVVYAYTVLRMRMTQEFNKVMPQLPEFSRRLLGVHRREPDTVAAGEPDSVVPGA